MGYFPQQGGFYLKSPTFKIYLLWKIWFVVENMGYFPQQENTGFKKSPNFHKKEINALCARETRSACAKRAPRTWNTLRVREKRYARVRNAHIYVRVLRTRFAHFPTTNRF